MNKQKELKNVKIEKYITELVFGGTLKEGDCLPSEREIANMFKASKIPVRQASQKLVDQGVLQRIGGKGTFIKKLQAPKVATNRIGILYPHDQMGFFASSYYAAIVTGIEMQAKKEKKNLLFRSLLREKGDNPAAVLLELQEEVDGFVVVDLYPEMVKKVESVLANISKPLVVVNYEGLRDEIDSVVTDSWEKTEKMVEFLINQGHARIACCYSATGEGVKDIHPSVVNRINAYKQTLSRHAIPIDNNLICHSLNVYSLKELLLTHTPTAFFCTGDYLALALYYMAKKLELEIPADITVVGFGGVPEGEAATPALTTIRIPLVGMGAAAVRRIIEKQKEKELGTGTQYRMVFPGSLVQRESHRQIN